MDEWLLIPNLGGEEGDGWPRFAALPPVAETARLWRAVFPARSRVAGPVDDGGERWPEALGPRPERAAFPWLDESPGLHPWLADAGARVTADAEGIPWSAAEPACTRAVHDKAFATETAAALGYEPRGLRGMTTALDPEAFRDADAALDRIEAVLASWPDWTGGRFVLKPRLGCSGRGRVAGARGAIDRDALSGALPRLAERGGAVLEPWLDRLADLSVALHLSPETEDVTLVGALEQIVSTAGVPLGHAGEVDSRGRVFSGLPDEEAVREAAAAIAREARARGYHGPCGVDAFTFGQPEASGEKRAVLRPVVELNARWTLGLVAIGLVRRALPRVRDALGLAPGDRRHFAFALAPPPGAGTWCEAGDPGDGEALLLDLSDAADARGPALVFASTRDALARWLGQPAEDPTQADPSRL